VRVEEIDKNNLDTELIRHAVFLEEASDSCAEATYKHELAVEEVKRVQAETGVHLRETSDVKLSEARVVELVNSNEDVIAARESRALMLKEKDIAIGHKEAMRARGHMIRDLCALTIAGYCVPNAVYEPDEEKPRKKSKKNTRKQINK